jgi:hypothetical protein
VLKAGRVVCLTEITDWLGGQATSEGVSALDEELDRQQLTSIVLVQLVG